MQLKHREELIARILAASRRPCLPIVPRYAVLCTDGEFRTSMPWGVKVAQPTQRKLLGYAFQNRDGTTGGRLSETAEELSQRHESQQDSQAAEFRAELETMPDDRFASQVAYWLKIEVAA